MSTISYKQKAQDIARRAEVIISNSCPGSFQAACLAMSVCELVLLFQQVPSTDDTASEIANHNIERWSAQRALLHFTKLSRARARTCRELPHEYFLQSVTDLAGQIWDAARTPTSNGIGLEDLDNEPRLPYNKTVQHAQALLSDSIAPIVRRSLKAARKAGMYAIEISRDVQTELMAAATVKGPQETNNDVLAELMDSGTVLSRLENSRKDLVLLQTALIRQSRCALNASLSIIEALRFTMLEDADGARQTADKSRRFSRAARQAEKSIQQSIHELKTGDHDPISESRKRDLEKYVTEHQDIMKLTLAATEAAAVEVNSIACLAEMASVKNGDVVLALIKNDEELRTTSDTLGLIHNSLKDAGNALKTQATRAAEAARRASEQAFSAARGLGVDASISILTSRAGSAALTAARAASKVVEKATHDTTEEALSAAHEAAKASKIAHKTLGGVHIALWDVEGGRILAEAAVSEAKACNDIETAKMTIKGMAKWLDQALKDVVAELESAKDDKDIGVLEFAQLAGNLSKLPQKIYNDTKAKKLGIMHPTIYEQLQNQGVVPIRDFIEATKNVFMDTTSEMREDQVNSGNLLTALAYAPTTYAKKGPHSSSFRVTTSEPFTPYTPPTYDVSSLPRSVSGSLPGLKDSTLESMFGKDGVATHIEFLSEGISIPYSIGPQEYTELAAELAFTAATEVRRSGPSAVAARGIARSVGTYKEDIAHAVRNACLYSFLTYPHTLAGSQEEHAVHLVEAGFLYLSLRYLADSASLAAHLFGANCESVWRAVEAAADEVRQSHVLREAAILANICDRATDLAHFREDLKGRLVGGSNREAVVCNRLAVQAALAAANTADILAESLRGLPEDEHASQLAPDVVTSPQSIMVNGASQMKQVLTIRAVTMPQQFGQNVIPEYEHVDETAESLAALYASVISASRSAARQASSLLPVIDRAAIASRSAREKCRKSQDLMERMGMHVLHRQSSALRRVQDSGFECLDQANDSATRAGEAVTAVSQGAVALVETARRALEGSLGESQSNGAVLASYTTTARQKSELANSLAETSMTKFHDLAKDLRYVWTTHRETQFDQNSEFIRLHDFLIAVYSAIQGSIAASKLAQDAAIHALRTIISARAAVRSTRSVNEALFRTPGEDTSDFSYTNMFTTGVALSQVAEVRRAAQQTAFYAQNLPEPLRSFGATKYYSRGIKSYSGDIDGDILAFSTTSYQKKVFSTAFSSGDQDDINEYFSSPGHSHSPKKPASARQIEERLRHSVASRHFHFNLCNMKPDVVNQGWFEEFNQQILSGRLFKVCAIPAEKSKVAQFLSYTINHQNSEVNGLTAGTLIMKAYGDMHAAGAFFMQAPRDVAEQIRICGFGAYMGTTGAKALLIRLFVEMASSNSHFPQEDLQIGAAHLLVAYLRREDKHTFLHRLGSPGHVRLEELFEFLSDVPGASTSIALHAIRTGLVFGTLLAFAQDVQKANGDNFKVLRTCLSVANTMTAAVADVGVKAIGGGIGGDAVAAAIKEVGQLSENIAKAADEKVRLSTRRFGTHVIEAFQDTLKASLTSKYFRDYYLSPSEEDRATFCKVAVRVFNSVWQELTKDEPLPFELLGVQGATRIGSSFEQQSTQKRFSMRRFLKSGKSSGAQSK